MEGRQDAGFARRQLLAHAVASLHLGLEASPPLGPRLVLYVVRLASWWVSSHADTFVFPVRGLEAGSALPCISLPLPSSGYKQVNVEVDSLYDRGWYGASATMG